jgi:hypothetical protein
LHMSCIAGAKCCIYDQLPTTYGVLLLDPGKISSVQ